MGLLSDIKRRFFRRRLAQQLRQAAPAPAPGGGPLNPATAASIAILFPADDAEDRKRVDRWRDQFRKSGKRIDVVGYFPGDVGQAAFDFVSVSQRTRNWYGAPVGEDVEQFLRSPCDLLLSLAPPHHPQLDYLAALKPAALKVGPRTAADDNPFHLQFDARDPSVAAGLAAVERLFSFTNATTPS